MKKFSYDELLADNKKLIGIANDFQSRIVLQEKFIEGLKALINAQSIAMQFRTAPNKIPEYIFEVPIEPSTKH